MVGLDSDNESIGAAVRSISPFSSCSGEVSCRVWVGYVDNMTHRHGSQACLRRDLRGAFPLAAWSRVSSISDAVQGLFDDAKTRKRYIK